MPSSNVIEQDSPPQEMVAFSAHSINDIQDARPEVAESILVTESSGLSPADTGRAAWLALASCSILQIPIWGFSLAFGVFQEHYASAVTSLNGNKANIATIGTTSTGLLYLISPITFTLLARWPSLRRHFAPLGLLLLSGGFLASSFASSVQQLIASQGIVCAVGSGLLFAPATLCLDEWFVRRKGLAYGTMWAAKSGTGVALPFIVGASLERFGARVTLQAWTVALTLITAPLLYTLRPRLPVAQIGAVQRIDTSFLRLHSFWVLQAGNIIQSLGYFLPSAYLPAYAVATLRLPPIVGTLLLAVLNATSIASSIVFGVLNDRFRVSDIVLVSSLGSAAAVLLLWGLAGHVAPLAVFAAAYGFFAGGFSSTWSGVQSELHRQSPALDTGLVFGLLAGGRGIGNVASGPLSAVLLDEANWKGSGKLTGYSTEYGPMIVFTGVTAFFGGWGWLQRFLRD